MKYSKSSPFDYGNSPMKHTKDNAGFEHPHPHTEKEEKIAAHVAKRKKEIIERGTKTDTRMALRNKKEMDYLHEMGSQIEQHRRESDEPLRSYISPLNKPEEGTGVDRKYKRLRKRAERKEQRGIRKLEKGKTKRAHKLYRKADVLEEKAAKHRAGNKPGQGIASEKKKIHQSGGGVERFTKGARTESGKYRTGVDVTKEKGKMTTYTKGDDGYTKKVEKKKKGTLTGEDWKTKREKTISEKKYKRQLKRKKKRYGTV